MFDQGRDRVEPALGDAPERLTRFVPAAPAGVRVVVHQRVDQRLDALRLALDGDSFQRPDQRAIAPRVQLGLPLDQLLEPLRDGRAVRRRVRRPPLPVVPGQDHEPLLERHVALSFAAALQELVGECAPPASVALDGEEQRVVRGQVGVLDDGRVGLHLTQPPTLPRVPLRRTTEEDGAAHLRPQLDLERQSVPHGLDDPVQDHRGTIVFHESGLLRRQREPERPILLRQFGEQRGGLGADRGCGRFGLRLRLEFVLGFRGGRGRSRLGPDRRDGRGQVVALARSPRAGR